MGRHRSLADRPGHCGLTLTRVGCLRQKPGTAGPYLATVIDLYSRKVVGWAIADHLRTDWSPRRCRSRIAGQAGVIFHTDRGAQYQCRAAPAHRRRSVAWVGDVAGDSCDTPGNL